MATFEIEQGGKTFEIEAPDQAAAIAALGRFTSQTPPAAPSSPPQATGRPEESLDGGRQGLLPIPLPSLPIQPSQEPDNPALADAVQSYGAGVRRGVASIPGIPGSLESLGRTGINWLARRTGRETPLVSEQTALPTGADYVRMDEDPNFRLQASPFFEANPPGTPSYQPQTTLGRYARTLGEFTPGAILPGSLATRVGMNVAGPAIASEAAGQATEGTPYEGISRVAGALVGPTLARGAMRAVTPLPATEARAAAVRTLADEGVDSLTAGQRTGNRPLQFMESNAREVPFGGGRAQEMLDTQGVQFTAAALRRAGIDGERATPDVMHAASTRLGNEFDRLVAGNNIDFTGRAGRARGNTLSGDSLRLEAEYNAAVPPTLRNPSVEGLVDDINNAIAQGRITGASYQPWRSRLGRMASSGTDVEFQRFARGLRDALDDAMASNMSAADQAAWTAARSQWGHLTELRQALATGGENTALGVITPARLGMADRAANETGFVEGWGRYADLARAGDATMRPLPNSGTPGRIAASAVPAALAGIMGHAAGGPNVGMSAAAVAAALAPSITARAVTSAPAQAYLGNQLLAPALRNMDPGRAAALQALTAPSHVPTLRGN